MNTSAIEWTDSTWNPTTGCDRVSPGCDNCYAQTLAKRLKAMGNPRYQIDGNERTSGPGFRLTLHWDKIEEPLKWSRPRHVFVNSMSDLFHDDVPEGFIEDVFVTMREANQHVFQILTKRPRRMRDLLVKWAERRAGILPLPNAWLGTSVEDQKRADLRIPLLLETPAAVRFLSCEPLLGPLDGVDLRGMDWVIVGGESGVGYRPVDPNWVRGVRDKATAEGIPFFFKQWGGRTPKAGGRLLDGRLWDEMPEVVEAEPACRAEG